MKQIVRTENFDLDFCNPTQGFDITVRPIERNTVPDYYLEFRPDTSLAPFVVAVVSFAVADGLDDLEQGRLIDMEQALSSALIEIRKEILDREHQFRWE